MGVERVRHLPHSWAARIMLMLVVKGKWRADVYACSFCFLVHAPDHAQAVVGVRRWRQFVHGVRVSKWKTCDVLPLFISLQFPGVFPFVDACCHFQLLLLVG